MLAAPKTRLDVEWPRDGAGEIRMRLGDGFEARVREIGTHGDGERVEQALTYQRAGGTSFWTAAPAGAEEWLLLDAASSRGGRHTAAWEITGATPRVRRGVVELLDARGLPRLRVTAPRAYSAGGRPLPARLAVRGSIIEVSVDAGEGDGEAVLVDPIWEPVGAMINARLLHVAGLVSTGEVLVAGGYGGTGVAIADAELYDPATGAWSPAAPMNSPRIGAEATTLADGQLFVTGGSDGPTLLDSAEIYDPATDTWTLTAPMSTVRIGHRVVRLSDGRVMVIGGGTTDVLGLADTEIYDPASETWTPAAPMNLARSTHTATLLADGRVLVIGGDQPGVLSAEIYDPVADAWTFTSSLPAMRWMTRAALLPTGDVLVTGGDDLVSSMFTAVRWVAATGEFVPVPPMATRRDRHTMTLLPSGMMLVTGGSGWSGPDPSAEVYDAAADAWRCTGDMITPRSEHTATVLPDGSVLIAGGDSQMGIGQSAEVFLPDAPSSCVSTDACAGGYFVDGVCCDAACDSPCMACSQAAGAIADGVCTLLSDVPCNDGNACTQNDHCSAGVCLGGTFEDICPPLGECKFGDAVCDPMMGCTTVDAPDGTACTGGTCLSGSCVPASTGAGGSAGGGDDEDDDDQGHDDQGDDHQGHDGSGHHGGHHGSGRRH